MLISVLLQSSTRTVFWWPICFLADWCNKRHIHSFASHLTHHVVHWSCLLIRLHQGIRHCQAQCQWQKELCLVSGKQLSSIRYHQRSQRRSQRLHKLQTTGRYQSRRSLRCLSKGTLCKSSCPALQTAVSRTVPDTAAAKQGRWTFA